MNYKNDYKMTEDVAAMIDAFASIEKVDLKPSRMICPDCGFIANLTENPMVICDHLRKFFEEIIEHEELDKNFERRKLCNPLNKLKFING